MRGPAIGNEVRVLITATDQASAKLTGVQKASLALTAGFAAVAAASVKMAVGFEKDMDNVSASLQATEKDSAALRKEALSLGKDTSKSAGAAAKAFQELAEGGRTAAQILGGEGRAAVALSEAANYDLAASAEYVATTLDAWKDSQLSTNDVVNRSAGVALVSKFGVEDLAGAVAQAGGIAASMGVSFADMSTSIAATASSFASGSDAGTSYKTFLLSLDGTTEKAKGTIKEYGLEFRNANGELKPMAEIVEELRTKVGTLGEAQQVAALKTIFGNDAYRTAAGLMNTTGAEFTALSDKMGSTNAAEIAKERMGNLSGSIEELKGSLETAGIAMGTKAIPALTTLADGATKAVNAFGELPGSTQNLLLLGAAGTAALPGMISLLDKATGQVKKMAAEFKTGKLTASSMALGLTAVAVGLDLILQKTTGAGLMDRIFGDVGKMEGGKEALADWNASLVAAGPNVDRLALSTEKFTRLIEEAGGPTADLKDEVDGLTNALLGNDARFFGFNVGASGAIDNTKELQAQTKLLAQEMVSSGASTHQLKEVYDQLPPALQKAFDSIVDVNRAYSEQQDAAERAYMKQMLANQSLAKVTEEAPKAASAIDEFTARVGEAEDGTKDFKAAIDALHESFAATNPTVIALNAQHAKLTEELEDLKDKGDDATASDKERIKVIEGQLLPAIDKEIKLYGDNQKAMEGMSGAAEKLLGANGYGALLDVMGKLKVPQEDQIALTGKIADAYSALTRNDIPAALKGFAEMKAQLSPEVWGPIAEALGPELSRKIKEGMSGPEKDAAVEEAKKLGIDIADGVAQGLDSAANRVVAKGRGLIIDLMGEMRAEAQTESPSKVTYKIGLDIAKGAELGIEDGGAGVVAAAAKLGAAAVGAVAGKAIPAGMLSGGGGANNVGTGASNGSATPTGAYGQGLVWDGKSWVYPWEVGTNLADSIYAWHKSPDFGQVGGNTGAAAGNQVIQIVLDGRVLAEAVAQQQARAY